MRKYFNSVDFIVFGVSFVCILWIIFFKIIWINTEPLFADSFKWADITYTVFSSIVAAGLFYLFTIFIPKFSQIKKLKKNLVPDLNQIEGISSTVVNIVTKGDTNVKYTFEEFSKLIETNSNTARQDFIRSHMIMKKLPLLKMTFDYLKSYIEPINLNYFNILPPNIIIILNDYKYRNLNVGMNIDDGLSKEIESVYENYFSQLEEILLLCRVLRKYYNIK
ncbi:MAG: hypothetical protein JZU53_13360 [Paludibacter sp.]|nr:hypothetical protein [Paludibacter sp.]